MYKTYTGDIGGSIDGWSPVSLVSPVGESQSDTLQCQVGVEQSPHSNAVSLESSDSLDPRQINKDPRSKACLYKLLYGLVIPCPS